MAVAVLPPLLLLLFPLRRLYHARAPAAHLYVIQFPHVVVAREQRLELIAAAAAAAMSVSGVLLAHDRVRIRVPLHAGRVTVQLAVHEQARFAFDARLARHLVESLLVHAVTVQYNTQIRELYVNSRFSFGKWKFREFFSTFFGEEEGLIVRVFGRFSPSGLA